MFPVVRSLPRLQTVWALMYTDFTKAFFTLKMLWFYGTNANVISFTPLRKSMASRFLVFTKPAIPPVLTFSQIARKM